MSAGIGKGVDRYGAVAEQLSNPSVKMNQLIQYAQGTNPLVPSFMALAEIQNRQNAVALQPGQFSPTTVQQDLIAKAETPAPMGMPGMLPQQAPQGVAGLQAPQGVAALPTGMGAQSFAGGGIVAFSGEDQSYVDPMGIGATPDNASDATPEDRALFERFKNYVNNIGGAPIPRGGAPVNALPGQVQAVRSGRGSGIPITSEQVKNMLPAEAISGDESKLFQAERFAKEKLGNAPLPTVGEKGRMAPTTKTDIGSDGATKEDMYAKYEKMLTEQGAESKAARQQDKYLRLLEAGLGIMGGTSPYAFANIGQGAIGAAKGYAQDKAAAAKEDRDNIKELMGLGLKKEEAQREAEKLSIMRKEAEDKGGYYGAYADYLKSGKGGAAAASMDKANLAAIGRMHAGLLKEAGKMGSPYYGKSAEELWSMAQNMVTGGGGGAPAPTTVQWNTLGAPTKP